MRINTPYPPKETYIRKLWHKHQDFLVPIMIGLTPIFIILGMLIYAFIFSN